MLRVLFLGAVLGLSLWIGTIGTGVAAAVMSQAQAYEISLLVGVANVSAPFLGGFAAGWMIKKRGWIHGGWVGVLYTIMAALAAAAAFGGLFILSISSLALNFCLGCVGGICGVNMGLYYNRSKRRKNSLGV